MEWAELSELVFNRDGWTCLAPKLDMRAGPCHDKYGTLIDWTIVRFVRLSHRVRQYLTLQHLQLDGKTEHDAGHLLTLCWGHHLGAGERGGRIWAKEKEALVRQRDYLAKQAAA